MNSSTEHNGINKSKKEDDGVYGVLDNRNIDRVVLGDYEFDTWYGNAAYFSTQDPVHDQLGMDFMNEHMVSNGKVKSRKRTPGPSGTTPRPISTSSTAGPAFGPTFGPSGPSGPSGSSGASGPSRTSGSSGSSGPSGPSGPTASDEEKAWIHKLFVCEYCFKYTTDHNDMLQHRQGCAFKQPYPPIGKLLYRDLISPYIIKRVRGFKHPLFCQNLSLFGKLFLDDKSVYYHLDYFDFYVIYGHDPRDANESGPTNFKPMGFFSKEVISWDNDNNLNCICVFPPYQRLHLGSLLIEFSYALAKLTPGQARSGPEFPLSPYGKLTYLRFWSKKLCFVLASDYPDNSKVTLKELADITGFRCEDILLTLEHMKVLQKKPQSQHVQLMLGNLRDWCAGNKIDPDQDRSSLNRDCLLI